MDPRRHLTVLHMALCLGCAAFLGVTAYLWGNGTVPLGTHGELPTLSACAVAAAVVLPVLAVVLFRRNVRTLVPGADMRLRGACVMHWALIEGALFLNLITFMLLGEPRHWLLGLGLLLVMVLRAPTERRMQRWTTGTP